MMAGNSQRRGAVRKGASRKGPTVGSGGQSRKGLQGKGPTPKAEDREKHISAKRKRGAERREAALVKGGRTPTGGGRPGGRTPGRPVRRSGKASSEIVAGRNSVVEALRADIPVTAMYVASRIDSTNRCRK